MPRRANNDSAKSVAGSNEPQPRYRLIRLIAAGGMAQVYEAVLIGAKGFERRVAIKRVLPQHAHDPAMQRMFFDEARLANRLHHGGIVQVLDYGALDGDEFIAMEYVDGADAWRAARQGAVQGVPLAEGLVLHLASEVGHALHYAHTRRTDRGEPLQIVHRDVSPQNILLSWQGDVKLSDFGIATALLREERTRTGVVKGKLGYMPPEQAAGHPVGPAADVYALGSSLRALLQASATSSAGPSVARGSPDTAELIQRCLQPVPIDRPTALEVAEHAGQLVAALLGRNPRGALCEWLGSIKPALTRRNALDELVNLALVPVAERQFTLSRGAATTTLQQTRGAEPQRREETPGIRSNVSRVRARIWPVVLLGGIGVVGLTGVLLWSAMRATNGLVSVQRTDADRATTPRVEQSTADARMIFPASPADSGSRATQRFRPGAVGTAPRSAAARRRSRRASPRRRRSESMTSKRGASQSTNSRGWLRVGGERLAGGRLEVDGKPIGYTPYEGELKVGTHTVVVRDPESGKLLATEEITIGTHHTRVNPRFLMR